MMNLLWYGLIEENANILNDQLKKEQHTSIKEINDLNRITKPEMVERVSRMEFLKLPKVDFYQLKVTYQSIEEEEKANTKEKLKELYQNIQQYKSTALITTTVLEHLDTGELELLNRTRWRFCRL